MEGRSQTSRTSPRAEAVTATAPTTTQKMETRPTGGLATAPTPTAISTEASKTATRCACMPAPEGLRCSVSAAEAEREPFSHAATPPARIAQSARVSAAYAPSSPAVARSPST